MDAKAVRPLRIYLGPRPQLDFHDRTVRLSLNPLARAQWDPRYEVHGRQEKYGALTTCFTETALADADVAALPLMWENTDTREAYSFIDAAERAGKRTIVIAGTDFEPIVDRDSVLLFHPGPRADARQGRPIFAVPYFFTDRFSGDIGRARKPDRPVVGFCGQATSSRPVRTAMQAVQRTWWAARRRSGHLSFNPPPLRGHLRLRSQAIKLLADHPQIDDRFIIRNDYRAGADTEEERQVTSIEFDQNLLESDYALCVRGSGNFSARFFEAMSFGRIPVFVNTNCVLPYEFAVDWRELVVWVEEDNINAVGEALLAFHARLSDEQFLARKRRTREIWEERLCVEGFFSHFAEHLGR